MNLSIALDRIESCVFVSVCLCLYVCVCVCFVSVRQVLEQRVCECAHLCVCVCVCVCVVCVRQCVDFRLARKHTLTTHAYRATWLLLCVSQDGCMLEVPLRR